MATGRLEKVKKQMAEYGYETLIISDPVSIYYITGLLVHPGERMLALLMEKDRTMLFINKLFPVKAAEGLELVWYSDSEDPAAILASHIRDRENSVIGIDKTWPARFLLRLQELMPNAVYKNGSMAVDGVRMMKDAAECDKMREASRLNDEALQILEKRITEGKSETAMISELQDIYRGLGTGFSFDPIICYGASCADPHHECNDTTVKPGDSVIMDIGCTYEKYCSDMTRTVFYKSVSEEGRRVYELVLKANLNAIAAVKPGARFCDIDNAARSVIEEAGYGPYFTHRTGHSIGLEVHDYGDVSSVNQDVLKPGMIFSVEPGIYLEGNLGVRIEDLVLVTEDGCEVLNKVSKELRIIG